MKTSTGLRGKLTLLMLVPLVALTILGGFRLWDEMAMVREANFIEKLIGLAEKSSAMIAEVQKERGMSAGYLSSVDNKNTDALNAQRLNADAAISAYMAYLDGEIEVHAVGEAFAHEIEDVKKELSELEEKRRAVNAESISVGDMVAYYSDVVEDTMKSLALMNLAITNAEDSRLLSTFNEIMWAMEFSGLERARLNRVFTTGRITSEDIITVSRLVSLQNQAIETFDVLSDARHKALLENASKDPSFGQVGKVREMVLNKVAKDDILQAMQQQMGYGGLIHEFKNYVIRGAARHKSSAGERFENIKALVGDYKALPNVSNAEKNSLDDILNVMTEYQNALTPVGEMVAQGRSVRAIDQSVKISDAPAINGIEALRKGNFGITSTQWWGMSSARINALNTVSDEVLKDLWTHAAEMGTASWARFFVVLVLVLGAVLVTVIVGVMIARGLIRGIDGIIGNLEVTSNQTLSASEQVAESSTQLAEGANEQAASLEETSATVEEMSSMTRNNAENAKKVEDLAGETKDSTTKGVQAMERMVVAMNDIKVSSDETAKIIKTIDEIAFQTNLLALNAAVEAARAGDAGRGFAVVAEEVRNLAQRSAEAAKSTSEMIEESQNRADAGVRVGEEVNEILSGINGAVDKVNGLIREVSTASNEQARGLEQLTKALGQLEGVTQSNASSAEENSSSSAQLTAQAQALMTVVNDLAQMIYGQAANARQHQTQGAARGGSARPKKLTSAPRPKPHPAPEAAKRMAPAQAITAGNGGSSWREELEREARGDDPVKPPQHFDELEEDDFKPMD